jgi:hypothetical protein
LFSSTSFIPTLSEIKTSLSVAVYGNCVAYIPPLAERRKPPLTEVIKKLPEQGQLFFAF